MLRTRLLRNRHLRSARNGQFIVALELLFLGEALGEPTAKEANGQKGRGGGGDSKGAQCGGRCVGCVGGLGGGLLGEGHGRDVCAVQMEGKEGENLGQVVGFFVGGDGTVEENGDGSVDNVTGCVGGGGGASV